MRATPDRIWERVSRVAGGRARARVVLLLACILGMDTADVATVPVGVYADRVNRVRMTWISMIVWTIAQAASGVSQTFEILLLIRIALGAATATVGPTIASLVGDFFPANERARIWGLILSGELIGAGFGYVISGEFAAFGSWRYAFFVLAVPSLVVSVAVRRWLVEPARGGRGA
jgi:MFS family permease